MLPEGSDFLMRWRFADIQRFLKGETVEPGQVFKTVHDLFTQYVDFRSEVESAILALWTIGTYFYTMFPAYPYLALNGPKNSGKSTVMRVMQPLAFNMVTTSDPTGPSMFRLIHYTSCTVGIDEAERYHNPKDPGMQQIRQLLNSGYKQGMPAIRLIGEDMKPQAFDVYSPKDSGGDCRAGGHPRVALHRHPDAPHRPENAVIPARLRRCGGAPSDSILWR